MTHCTLAALVFVAACRETETEGEWSSREERGGEQRESWAIGFWFSPEYQGDSFTPAMGLIIDADGTWTHSTDGFADAAGTWREDGLLSFDGGDAAEVLPNCRSLKFGAAGPYTEYHREDHPAGCPITPEPLSAAERCLVGEFERHTSSSVNDQYYSWTTTSDRTTVSTNDYESLVSDSMYFTNVAYWHIDGVELVSVDVSGYEVREPLTIEFWQGLDGARVSPREAGCDLPTVIAATPDVCEQQGLYGNGVCDYPCGQADPDCDFGGESDICADNDWYGDLICDEVCASPDPDCSDECAVNGWYGDMICDEVCASPDPDCSDECALNDWYGDDICDTSCAQPDPDCE